MMERVKNTIRKYRLLNKFDKIVMGVSGGPDSVALLYILNGLKKEFKLNLYIAHLDHMLRKDSCRDAEFVRGLADKLKIPVTIGKINVRKLAEKGSLEEAARNARLGFLFKIARDIKANKIALGHNLDDQAETVMMRILRGSGLYGLCGISPKREIAGFLIIRPLIETSRREIEAYLRQKKIRSCFDKTNLEEVYFRNKIRKKLMPLLEKDYNKNIKEVLSNMADAIGCDYDYLNRAASQALKRLGSKINLRKFLRLHSAIRRLVLRLKLAQLKGDMRRFTFQHIKELEDLILNRPANSIVDLPQGISVSKRKKYLFFYRRNIQ